MPAWPRRSGRARPSPRSPSSSGPTPVPATDVAASARPQQIGARRSDPTALVEAALAGDRLALADPDGRRERTPVAEARSGAYPIAGKALTGGDHGTAGIGQVDAGLGADRGGAQAGRAVAVDPSSPITGGALLGDRVRMQSYATDRDVFIRSMAARGHAGGLASTSTAAAAVLDAAGFDLILLETVGTGQSEVEVAAAADTTVVLEAPEMGDEIQAIKAGLLEVADIVVVNKGDRRERSGPPRSCGRCWWRSGGPAPARPRQRSRHRSRPTRARRRDRRFTSATEGTGGSPHDGDHRRRIPSSSQPWTGTARAARSSDTPAGSRARRRRSGRSSDRLGRAPRAREPRRHRADDARGRAHRLDPFSAADELLATRRTSQPRGERRPEGPRKPGSSLRLRDALDGRPGVLRRRRDPPAGHAAVHPGRPARRPDRGRDRDRRVRRVVAAHAAVRRAPHRPAGPPDRAPARCDDLDRGAAATSSRPASSC